MNADKVVFFDLFDTLVKVDRGYLEPYFDRETDRLGDLGILKNAEQTIQRLIDINEANTPNLLETYSINEMARYYENRMRESLMNPPNEVLMMLQSLKDQGIPMCVISDAAYVDIMHWNESPLAKYFDHTCFSCEIGLVKPNPELFKYAQSLFGYPDKSIFIGDGGHEELIGAQQCSMQTIKAEWIKNRREEAIYRHADKKLQMATQVPHAVQEMNRGIKQIRDENKAKIDYAVTCFKEQITPTLCRQETLEYYFGNEIANEDVVGMSVPLELLGLDELNNHATLTNVINTDIGIILIAEDSYGNKYSLSSIDIENELAEIATFDMHQLEPFGFIIEDGEIIPTRGSNE